jgi:hypothetical protein
MEKGIFLIKKRMILNVSALLGSPCKDASDNSAIRLIFKLSDISQSFLGKVLPF